MAKTKRAFTEAQAQELLSRVQGWGDVVFRREHLIEASDLPPAVTSQIVDHLYTEGFTNADEYDENENPVWFYLTTKAGGTED